MRAFKRIDTFTRSGYDVNVYMFDRGVDFPMKSEGLSIYIMGAFNNDLPHLKRIKCLLRGMRSAFNDARTKKAQNECFYYFSMPICAIGYLLNRRKYVYEESDMTHLNVGNKAARSLLERVDQYLIRHASLALFTSEGFIRYHLGQKGTARENVICVPNKLRQDIKTVEVLPKHQHAEGALRFGFVGFIRYTSVYRMAEIISRRFPQHEVHFYGVIYESAMRAQFESLQARDNVYFHGGFKNPDDLGKIYAGIDVLICTYDITSVNVQYAEPNKLYESIYFRTPIIVSEHTFLQTQVERYRCGYSINAQDEPSVIRLVGKIESDLGDRVKAIETMPRDLAIDNPDALLHKFSTIQFK